MSSSKVTDVEVSAFSECFLFLLLFRHIFSVRIWSLTQCYQFQLGPRRAVSNHLAKTLSKSVRCIGSAWLFSQEHNRTDRQIHTQTNWIENTTPPRLHGGVITPPCFHGDVSVDLFCSASLLIPVTVIVTGPELDVSDDKSWIDYFRIFLHLETH